MRRLCAIAIAFIMVSVVIPPSAQASDSLLCRGYGACHKKKLSHFGYGEQRKNSYWRMYPGNNCTNYVAYRLIGDGMEVPPAFGKNGSAAHWGRAFPSLTTAIPSAGAIAWWKHGHVAYVEEVPDTNTIVVSEDNWGGSFQWRRVTKKGRWPDGFIHLNPAAANSPNGTLVKATSTKPGRIRLTGTSTDPDAPKKATKVRVYIGGPAGSPTRRTITVKPGKGFAKTIKVPRAKKHSVYVYGLNAPGTAGTYSLLGWQRVTMKK